MKSFKMYQKSKKLLSPYWHLQKYLIAKLLRNLPSRSEKIGPPKKFYESTLDWVNISKLDKTKVQGSYEEIHPGHNFYPLEPITPDDYISSKFRTLQHEIPPAFVAVIPDGRVWGYNGSVISPDDGLLADVSREFVPNQSKFIHEQQNKHSIFRQFQLPPLSNISGTVAVLAGRGSDVYYHWMFDLLPRIDLLRRSSVRMDHIDRFVVNEICLKFQKETLTILGIPETKIIETKKSSSFHIKADRLVVFPLPRFRGGSMPKWVCDFLRREFLNSKIIEKSDGQERIYISRADASHRQVKNETDLINFLIKFGFKSVTLSSMSLVEQISLFSSAKVIVAAHGAGLTNTVFCNPGTKVIEFFSPNYLHPVYWRISNHVGLKYYCFLGESQHLPKHTDPKEDDILINLDSLLKVMRLAGIK
jgi:capsular polysaccharide biosynthesis protein